MVLTLLVIICLVGIFISCYALMTDKLDTKSCLDVVLFSFIGIGWMVLLEGALRREVEYPIIQLVIHTVMLYTYFSVIKVKYYKDKEKSLCGVLSVK